MSAFIGLGITQGAKDIQKYEQGREMREIQRAEAMNRRDLSQMQLDEYKNNADVRDKQKDLLLAQTVEQTRQANVQNLRGITYSAFDKYEADGDVRHLNNMLRDVRKNPIGAKSGSKIARYHELSDTPEIRKAMVEAGYNDFDGIIGDPDLKKSFVATTDTDGELQIWDVDKVYAASGYGRYMDSRNLESARKRAEISEMLRKGNSLTEVQMMNKVVDSLMKSKNIPYAEAWKEVQAIRKGSGQGQDLQAINLISEEEKISTLEAAERYYGLKNSGRGQTDQERFVQDYMANNDGANREEAVREYKNSVMTSQQKNQAGAEEAKDRLDEIGFLDMDLNELSPTDRAKIQRDISSIENLAGADLTNEDKRVLRDLNNLTMLGGTAGEELTDQETGILDSWLNSVKKYVVSEVGGSEATSNYETFRNIFRNSLYGSALTDAEIKAFNAAAGTLGQRFPQVLSRLNTQMKSIKNQLETLRNTNDPYVAKYYLGGSVSDIDNAIRQIDSRLDLFNSYEGEGLTSEEVNKAKPLEDILGDI